MHRELASLLMDHSANDVCWRHVADDPHCSRMQIRGFRNPLPGPPALPPHQPRLVPPLPLPLMHLIFFFSFNFYCIFKQIGVKWREEYARRRRSCSASRAVKMCITPSAPPGTLYFHGPASDVNAPAVLWIVRTDYSVGVGGGRGLEVSSVCVCRMWCVRAS